MFPTEREEARNSNHVFEVGKWKGELFGASQATYFVESERGEAKIIREIANKTVVCPNDGIYF